MLTSKKTRRSKYYHFTAVSISNRTHFRLIFISHNKSKIIIKKLFIEQRQPAERSWYNSGRAAIQVGQINTPLPVTRLFLAVEVAYHQIFSIQFCQISVKYREDWKEGLPFRCLAIGDRYSRVALQ